MSPIAAASLFREPPFRVMIIGDVMIDRYLQGRVNRISPEAPVPIVHYQSRQDRLGGAANVAVNLRELGADARLIAVCGQDEEEGLLRSLLQANGLDDQDILSEAGRLTTLKTRILAGSQQLLRIDAEDSDDLLPVTRERILEHITRAFDQARPDVVILQDYNKGVLSPELISAILELARSNGVPVSVDPKFRHFLSYRGATLFKPNLKELSEGLGMVIRPELPSLREACVRLHGHLEHRFSLVTLSEHGIFWYDHEREEAGLLPPRPRDIVDVCGAGDTVIATASLALAAGWPLEELARVANLAGGQVCERPGVVPVDRWRLQAELEENRAI